MNTATSRFVEEMGLLFEAERFPRIAGRILGLLLTTEDARSLDDLAADLDVTKASISTNARLLEQRGVLERISRRGDRRDHYRVASDLPHRTLQARVAKMTRVRQAFVAGRAYLPLKSRMVRDRFDAMIAHFDHFLAITTRALDELARSPAGARPIGGRSK